MLSIATMEDLQEIPNLALDGKGLQILHKLHVCYEACIGWSWKRHSCCNRWTFKTFFLDLLWIILTHIWKYMIVMFLRDLRTVVLKYILANLEISPHVLSQTKPVGACLFFLWYFFWHWRMWKCLPLNWFGDICTVLWIDLLVRFCFHEKSRLFACF